MRRQTHPANETQPSPFEAAPTSMGSTSAAEPKHAARPENFHINIGYSHITHFEDRARKLWTLNWIN